MVSLEGNTKDVGLPCVSQRFPDWDSEEAYYTLETGMKGRVEGEHMCERFEKHG